MLAARALGLGATLTTLYLAFEKEVEAALGLPADVHSYALLPIGYPMGRCGPVRRVPLSEVVYENRGAGLIRPELGPKGGIAMKLPQTGGCQCGKIRLRDHRSTAIGLYVPLHRLPALDQQRLLDGARRHRDRLSSQRRGTQTSAARGR